MLQRRLQEISKSNLAMHAVAHLDATARLTAMSSLLLASLAFATEATACEIRLAIAINDALGFDFVCCVCCCTACSLM